jgi:L-ascorbate metabolism protein UlaG (beta-lactamase superfamily)
MKLRGEPLLLLGSLALAGCQGDLLTAQAEGEPTPAASVAEAFEGARVTDRFSTPRGTVVSLLPIEHASFVLAWEDKVIYVDPAVPSIDDATLPKADVVLITGAQYDHLDPVYVSRVRQPRTVVVGPEAAAKRAAIDVVLHNREERALLGMKVTAVPSYNITRGPVAGVRYHEKGQDNGYVLDLDGLRIYVSGDTDCTPEIASLQGIDVAFVGLNVPYAMDPGEASQCLAAFHPSVVIPYAYRHADVSALRPPPGTELRRRDFYLPVERIRQHAYREFSHGMWGYADDLLDLAKVRDPKGDADWRVQMTRRWLKEYERWF